MNCLLCGIKHCGKTTLGKLLAQKWNALFVDSDELLETRFFLRTGRSLRCRELYAEFGEDAFRKMEAEALIGLAGNGDEFDREKVIALGGGAVENPHLPPGFLSQLGTVVHLEADPAVAYARIAGEGELPPFLRDAEDPAARFAAICERRETAFRRCADRHFRPDPEKNARENCEALAALLTTRKD